MTTSQTISDALKAGFLALDQGDLKAAEQYCKQVMQANPRIAGGHFLIGLLALEQGQRRIAANAFLTTTKLEPSHAGGWAHLAKIFCELGYTARADEALQKAEKASPDIPALQNVIGMVNSLIGEHGKARKWYEKAFTAAPHVAGYGVNLSNALNFTGHKSAAIETSEQVLKLEPDNAQAHWALAGLQRATSAEHAEQMLEIAGRSDQNDASRSFLYYGAGKVFEDVEDWPAAFEAFSKGAAAKRATQAYDEAEEQAVFDTLKARLNADWMARPVTNAPTDFAPIFILGQPRTGTTLIERILTAHSKIIPAGELQQFYLSIRRGARINSKARITGELMAAAAELDPAALGHAYQAATRSHQKPGQFFIDKLPTNYLYVPLIAKALPGAKIIHVRRDPMDSCFSSFKQLFADAYPHSYDLETMARHHVRYQDLMAHWRNVIGDRLFEVSYEDTVADLEKSARALIDHIGVDWEPACLEFHTQSAAVSTASAAQVREPVHARSVGRWKKYASQLAPVQNILSEAGLVA